ncbi:unnamed protein product [Gongylonema pulchrum]|uniref:[histone H3]-lysine(27) N-trimethyltransferase n=1 Tax=Gongylonema pulchrum TaxID=637853 RepID=A0A183E4P8_9BILA|nr:unnamed protein product [Gongylonema pulchrum]
MGPSVFGDGWSARDDREVVETPPPKELCVDVTEIYADVMERYKKMIGNEGAQFYEKMLDEEPRKIWTAGGTVVEPDKTQVVPEQPTYCVVRSAQGAIIKKCPSCCIEHAMSTPRMQYWTLTECNVLCEDERSLSHIPFLGDREEDDAGFGEELLKTFQELLTRLFEKHSNIAEELVYRAVYEQFPNKASVQQLPVLYEDLKRRFDPCDTVTSSNDQPLSLDMKSLQSFRVLMCKRCLTYDCLVHGLDSRETEEVPRRRTKNRIVPNPEPCGPECFKHVAGNVMEEAERRGFSPDSKTVDAMLNIKTDEAHWTAGQESAFLLFRRIFNNDFCKLAEVLNIVATDGPPKTCREVYAYSFRSAPISPRADLSPISPKKKKSIRDQHRVFRSVKWAKTEGKVRNTHVYEPCSHAGPCSTENNCTCVLVDNLCTKFPGCRCAPGMCRTKQCQCFYANWECDPDVCKSCKSGTFDSTSFFRCPDHL